MKVYTAPEAVPADLADEPASVMLLGSIEQDKASKWQDQVIDALAGYPVAIFNPRRKSWDASLKQSATDPVFSEQVNWELDQIWRSDITFMFLEPGTKSPISLLELGFVAGRGLAEMFPVIVVCPDGFWRQGNVDIVAERAGFLVCRSLKEGIHVLKETISEYLQSWAH
jgi:hypothetical protein